MARLEPLSQLPTHDRETGDLVVIIETPKLSRSKYAYDEKSGAFTLKFVLPEGMTFPVDFGFFPSTLADDGDPLDAIILLDESLAVGTKVSARVVAAIKAEERETDGKWDRNDRIMAIATHAHAYERVHSLADLDPLLLDRIERFFEDYNRQHGKDFRVKARLDAKDANDLVKKAKKAYAHE